MKLRMTGVVLSALALGIALSNAETHRSFRFCGYDPPEWPVMEFNIRNVEWKAYDQYSRTIPAWMWNLTSDR